MGYLKTNRMKLVIGFIILFILFHVYKFIDIRIKTLDFPKCKITFSSAFHGNNEIYVMNLNGTTFRRLTNYSRFGRTFDKWISDYRPSLSYDGKEIVFDSDRDDKRPKMGKSYYSGDILSEKSLPVFREIYIKRVDGNETIRLTHNQSMNLSPVFSPDGHKILFYSVPFPKNPFYEELRVMDSKGIWERILVEGNNVSNLAKFSLDSRKIFFVLRGDLYSIDVNSNTQIRLTYFNTKDIERPEDTEGQPFINEFALSPDGKEITLVTREKRAYQFIFYSINVDGSKMLEIAHFSNTSKLLYAATINNLLYSPDGQKIAFISSAESSSIYILDNYKFRFIRNLNRVDSGIEDIENNRFIFTPDTKHIIFIAAFPYDSFSDQVTWIKSIIYETFWKIKFYIFRRISASYDNKYLCIVNLETGSLRKIVRLPLSSSFGRDFIHWEK